jgi:hypothetical protein
MPPLFMEGLSLFGKVEPVDFAVADPLDVGTEARAHPFPEQGDRPEGRFHRLLGLGLVFNPLPAIDGAEGKDDPDQGSAGLTLAGHASGQSTGRLEDRLGNEVKRFLQTCKNGLASALVAHLVTEGPVVNLLKQLLFFAHQLFLLV